MCVSTCACMFIHIYIQIYTYIHIYISVLRNQLIIYATTAPINESIYNKVCIVWNYQIIHTYAYMYTIQLNSHLILQGQYLVPASPCLESGRSCHVSERGRGGTVTHICLVFQGQRERHMFRNTLYQVFAILKLTKLSHKD